MKRTKNKITTQAYFISRLRDNGYIVDRLFSNYGKHDPRTWTCIVDPGVASVMITCMRNVDDFGVDYFEIYDSGQFTPKRLKVATDSLETIVEYLNEFGIINKSSQYNESGPKRIREQKAKEKAEAAETV